LIGQSRVGEEMIDAGAERKDRLELLQVFERARRMAPAQRIADGVTVERLVEHYDLMGRQQRFHPPPPGLGIPAGDSAKYAHGGVASMRSITGSTGESGASSRR